MENETVTAQSTKLYVGSLPYNWAAEQLEEAFKPYGKVTSAAVVADQLTKRSKGFGFVEFESGKDASKAMSELNGREFEGRSIAVREARPQADRAPNERQNAPDRPAASPKFARERFVISNDHTESTDTTGRSYGNRRGWW
jgi:RNA recognition motif-containing protein